MTGKAAVEDRIAWAEDHTGQAECAHHWSIEIAAGPVSMGTCQICGTRKEFHNYLPDCLADKDREAYEGWLARHSQNERRRARAKGGVMIGTGED